MPRLFPAALVLFSSLLSVRGSECPDDWVSNMTSCYVYVDDVVTWTGAQTICRMLNAHVVEIESAQENSFIVSQMDIRHAHKTWLGFNDFVREGKFVWSSSNEPMEYTHWAPGEPNNHHSDHGDQDCGVILANGLWDDDYCENIQSHMYTFFCEQMNGESELVIG